MLDLLNFIIESDEAIVIRFFALITFLALAAVILIAVIFALFVVLIVVDAIFIKPFRKINSSTSTGYADNDDERSATWSSGFSGSGDFGPSF